MLRRAIDVRGRVQGVGFRPYVQRLASGLDLSGFVRNQPGGGYIEVKGESGHLESFIETLTARPPDLARIESVASAVTMPLGDRHFRIQTSHTIGSGPIIITPDAATCPECLAELFDPHNRRFGYAFINCTNCGPRLTIVTGAPYDRQRTTMAGVHMCPRCRAEYEDLSDRRFHAQATCCPDCGPHLTLRDSRGETISNVDPMRGFADAIAAGKIGAIKGLGGYHLVCAAANDAAFTTLRQRKHREEKPLAIRVRDLAEARTLCVVDDAEARLLQSPRRPIVLLRRRPGQAIAAGIAPGNPCLGIMLPCTPIHHLLLAAVGDRALVMTSGNQSDEPIANEDDAAILRLGGIADVLLTHDRATHVRYDNSVVRVMDGVESPIRPRPGMPTRVTSKVNPGPMRTRYKTLRSSCRTAGIVSKASTSYEPCAASIRACPAGYTRTRGPGGHWKCATYRCSGRLGDKGGQQ
jgi:hydrogenase maturation protein HypF